jgi:hypothetical protein
VETPANIPIVEDLSFAEPVVTPWAGIVGLSLAVAAVVALTIALLVYWRRRRRYVATMTAPQRRALGDLEAAWRQWRSTGYLQFLFLTTEIIRVYLESRFLVPAPTKTTEEILAAAAEVASPLDGDARRILKDLLLGCDVLKFASRPAVGADIEDLYQTAREFIRQTAWQDGTWTFSIE